MAVDFFLKLDDIKGEATDKNHKDEISVLSWSWGGSQTSSVASGGGSATGKASLSDLHIVKHFDVASVKLLEALLKGKSIGTGVLTASKSVGDDAGKPFIKVTLSDIFLTSVQSSGSSEIPTESISFSYSKIKLEYSKQNDKNVLTAAGSVSYDVKQNSTT